jgi:hypothetical protein
VFIHAAVLLAWLTLEETTHCSLCMHACTQIGCQPHERVFGYHRLSICLSCGISMPGRWSWRCV